MVDVIKGVNKRIIEVINPEDHYFEKVILFLSPQASEEQDMLHMHVQKYLKSLTPSVPRKRKTKSKAIFFLQLAGAALLGGAAVLLLHLMV